MSDWGGPYVSVMVLLSAKGEGASGGLSDDEGDLGRIDGIASEATIARPGENIRFTVLLHLISGNMRGTDKILLGLIDLKGNPRPFPPKSFSYGAAPEHLVEVHFDVMMEDVSPGLYWIRAQIRNRMLSRIPLRVSLLPEIPTAFLELE